MGVAKTLPNYKSFTFDGTNSRSYGVYITGEGVFNAPERNVEMVEIPGRDGAYALDKGNFNNIEVTYPAGIFADTEADFAQAVSDLRNFLCSKSGYCRLEDDYNSGEYRMAVYKSGLDVDHDMLIAGEFNIVFECKPQRYLTSGETATAVTSGGKVTNPTLFDAKPQLQVWGYGDIDLGSEQIIIENIEIGEILLAVSKKGSPPMNYDQTLDMSSMNVGDSFTVSGDSFYIRYSTNGTNYTYTSWNIVSNSNCNINLNATSKVIENTLVPDDIIFAYGTTNSLTATETLSVSVYNSTNNTTNTYNLQFSCTISYDGNSTINYSSSYQIIPLGGSTASNTCPDVFGHSTKSANGTPTYIDLDIGEAYNIENGSAVSVNNGISLPAELPVLPPGDTTITYDNTITQFKILPRWWKV